ncbi:Hint domain-containing protein [Profundibacter sp.]
MADQLLGGIVINEVLVDPNGANNFDTDGNGTAAATDEYVELVNTSNVAIDISGLQMWDQGVGNWFTFPPGTILQPGGHAMVMSGVQAGGSLPTGGPNDLFFDAGRGSALINNGGDNIVIYDPANDEFIQATFNGDPLDDPTATYAGFSATATRVGLGENFGNDNDGFSIQRAPDGSGTFVNNVTPTPGTTNICFTQGTLFETPDGPRRIEHLRPGDLLMTKDNGPQTIRWIWARHCPAEKMRDTPALAPIRIEKGALGSGLPRRDLTVSRHHRLMIRSKIAHRMYGRPEVLAPAKDLTAIKGIDQAPITGGITYYHILMDTHEILIAEGTPAESLYLGSQTLHTIEPAARAELRLIFGPGWDSFIKNPASARLLVSGEKTRNMARRHRKNNKPALNDIAL